MDETYLEEDAPITWAGAWEHLADMQEEIVQAAIETALMLGIGLGAALLFGLPLGVLLYLTRRGNMADNPWLHGVLSWVVNLVRSFPFIILMVVLSGFTRIVAGTSIGPLAAAVPLSFAAIPYFARLAEQSLREIPRGVLEAAQAMGASPLQIIVKVLLVEARAGLIAGFTILTISFLSYSAVAGVVGGGGIGDLAIRYGYQRYDTVVLVAMSLLLIVLVQGIQLAGNYAAARLDKR
ncbi:D-methionine transport system permease protein [Brachymonas denitrificans DSM 15123]|uniref:D-methionine transport system permease protein n=2 Tax=Brachymonas denitrificans TaxID=28220 RepID=A0A1H8IP95_9BURK|nr:D-methionine transport system permease protein [Brachymonas denitrificans DSM 15123]